MCLLKMTTFVPFFLQKFNPVVKLGFAAKRKKSLRENAKFFAFFLHFVRFHLFREKMQKFHKKFEIIKNAKFLRKFLRKNCSQKYFRKIRNFCKFFVLQNFASFSYFRFIHFREIAHFFAFLRETFRSLQTLL